MSHTTLTCPECQTTLKPNKPVPPGARLKCPKCQTAFFAPPAALPEDPEEPQPPQAPGGVEELEETEELEELPPAQGANAASVVDKPLPKGRRLDDADDRTSRRRKGRGRDDEEDGGPRKDRKVKKAGMPVWVWLAIGGGGLVLLLCCGVGGVVALMTFGSRVTMENYEKIKADMTEDQVKAILGEPTEQSEVLGIKVMEWKSGSNVIEVSFTGHKVFTTSCEINGVKKGKAPGLGVN
jgi:hypothetical protein